MACRSVNYTACVLQGQNKWILHFFLTSRLQKIQGTFFGDIQKNRIPLEGSISPIISIVNGRTSLLG